ncbi:component of IIS longevity pathway SMK-1-domain-containing protein [Collybia nuda]|uniref:Component of IIS longevity pathway SMK-1-domain-containing protein n=1 Tax=Collybia nuda TaxID=64659 RepID=A0A9P6CLJ7_9AGAR|nr:component of IIS longevity pathway SMK-1-domain-containing protein [Collybia nuda]
MNSDAGSENQLQSLLSTSSPTSDTLGAGSTIPSNSQQSSDLTTQPSIQSSIDLPENDSTPSTDALLGSSDTTKSPGDGGGVLVAAQDKDREHDLEVGTVLESVKDGEAVSEPVNGQIELLEHTPETVVDEGQDWLPDSDHEMKRVKVYELVGARWADQGTAFCFGQFQEETNEALLIARSERNYNEIILSTAIRSNDVYQRQQDTLIVWTEPDGVDYALSFQDPEGCAEVWNFIQEVQRHMNNGEDHSTISSSPHAGPEPASVTTAGIIRSGHLPQPQLGIIGEIERAIKTLARTQSVKERICEYIQQEDYIKSLIEVMNTAEDLESLDNLHALCSIMQTILMLNDHTMYEHILEDDIFFGVVGMLEYDPDFPKHKANYREFLNQTSHFHEPIPIRDTSIQRKIHHTYRLQFLKDVVLARALDDSTFNVLNSCIIFNQIDIITHVQQDYSFLRDIVRLFVDEEMLSGANGGPQNRKIPLPGQPQQPPQGPIVISLNENGDSPGEKDDSAAMDVDPKLPPSPKLTNGSSPVNGRPKRSGFYAFAPPEGLSEEDIALRREVIILVQQLCVMGKNVQLPARMALFRALVDRGVLFGVQWALNLPEKEASSKLMIGAAGEILVSLLDHDLNGVRGHVLKQVVAIEKEREAKKRGADKAETILEMACRIMAQSRDLAVQSQIGDALKVWMDLPGELPTSNLIEGSQAGPSKLMPRKDDPGTERYMDYFYKECLNILFKPFYDLPEWRNVNERILPLTREETNRYLYLCDLFYNFTAQHHFRSHFYLMSNNIVVRVASLLKAKDKHLRHASFRIFRLLLKQNNQNTHALIMKHDVLKPILDLTLEESRRDNLLSCSCQEYFENMRRENMKDMIKFCMTKHESEIRTLARSPLGGQRFELLIRRWEMNNEPLPEDSKPEKPAEARGWPQGRSLDAEEEDYFNADDDDDDSVPIISQARSRGTGALSPLPNTTLKRKRRIAIGNSPKGYRPPLKTPVLGSLVDYGEEEEEEELLPAFDESSSTKLASSQSSHKPSRSPSPEIPPASPKLSHRQIPTSASGPPPKRPSKEEDEEDNLLESLVRPRSRPQSPAPGMMSSSTELMRPSEKRRRVLDDDEDDELLERLSKSKKQDLGAQKDRLNFGGAGRTKNGDDPPKKIKVKFGATSLAVVSAPSAPVPTEAGAKDGDRG